MSEAQQKLKADLATNTSYGWWNGCLISINPTNGMTMYIYVGTEPQEREDAAQVQIQRAQTVVQAIQPYVGDNTYKIKNVSIFSSGTVVVVDFGTGFSTGKRAKQFANDHLAEIAPLCSPHTCAFCGKPVGKDAVPVMSAYGAIPAHPACVDAEEIAVESWEAKDEKTYNMAGGILGAVAGMLLGTALWLGIGMLGYVAAIAGLVMAVAIGKGYDLLGGKPGKFKLVLMIVLIILGVTLATMGITAWQAHQYYKEETANLKPWEVITISEKDFITDVCTSMFTDPEYLSDTLKELGQGLFFALLGCFGVLRTAGRHPDKPHKPRQLRGNL